jgi:uncharacterized repeat protein (TIGR01451 family)
MKVQHGRQVAGVGAIALMVAALVASAPASAAPAGAVPFGEASFHGYASGQEIHVGAIQSGSTSVADVEEGYSGASTSTAGLASPIVGDDAGDPGTGLLVQPVQPSTVNAFGTGAGLEAGLVAPADASADQLKLAGLTKQVAQPNTTATTNALPSSSCPEVNGVPACLNLSGLATANVLLSRAAAVYSATQCPLGQPISYGLGQAAGAGVVSYSSISAITSALSTVLKALGITVPTTGNIVTNAGDANSVSETYLSANGDGTFGLSTQANTTIAPISINLLGIADLELEVGGALGPGGTANPAVPISLTATATGESHGAEVTLGSNDVVSLTLILPGTPPTSTVILPATSLDDLVGEGGLILQLDPQTLVSQLAAAVTGNPVLNSIPTVGGLLGTVVTTISKDLSSVTSLLPAVDLGEIDVGTPPRAINSDPASKVATTPTPIGTPSSTEGTEASAAFDLARIKIAPDIAGVTTNIANLAVGHLEAAADLAAPITCTIPIIKSANPPAVTAGQNFVYTIEIPNPAEIALLSCDLDNITATDTIADKPDSGDPTFEVAAVSNGGTVTQTSDRAATVTWTGLTYKVAAVGDPPNPPITLTITVVVPATSPAGTIQDVIVATGTAEDCNGGASGTENLGDTNGTSLTGMYTLPEPPVTALPPGSATTTTVPGAPGPSSKLPFTGAIGGLWQPFAGLGALGLGGGALALVRRSRRRSLP